jgi:ubiquinone biosynthesis protein COQ9
MKSLDFLKFGDTPNYSELFLIVDDVTKYVLKSCELYHKALDITNINGGI